MEEGDSRQPDCHLNSDVDLSSELGGACPNDVDRISNSQQRALSLLAYCCTSATVRAVQPRVRKSFGLQVPVSAARCCCSLRCQRCAMRARNAVHVNGAAGTSAAAAAPQTEPIMPQHLAAMATSDEVEQHIAHLRQRIASLPSVSSSSATAATDRALLTAELLHARSRLSSIQANGRYLALLPCGAMLVVFIVFLLCGWHSPIVHLHNFINSASRDRMARMGINEAMLDAQRDDQPFIAAFDWWSWMWQRDSGGKP